MSRNERRPIKTRNPKELTLATAVTVVWVVFGSLFFVAGGSGGKANPTAFLVITALTPLVWWWAIHAVRTRNVAGKTLTELQALSPDQFEEWVGARFRELGYVVKIAGMQGDHGVDLVVEKDGKVGIIQCKRYKASSVGEPTLRDLYGAMHDFGAMRAYLVTTGSLTKPAADWVRGKPIEVWDREYLARLSTLMKNGPNGKNDRLPEVLATDRSMGTPSDETSPEVLDGAKPKCPKCSSPLVVRRNRQSGEAFLACPRYPACWYTQPLGLASQNERNHTLR